MPEIERDVHVITCTGEKIGTAARFLATVRGHVIKPVQSGKG